MRQIKKPYNITTKEYGVLMYWAYTARQAVLLAQKFERGRLTVKGVNPNFHAMNMEQKPQNYGEFLAYGGGV